MGEYEIIVGDMFDKIGSVKPASCKLALIDPPYMVGSVSAFDKERIDPWGDLMNGARFFAEVIEAIKPKLAAKGSLWMFGNWRGAASIYKAACMAGWIPSGCAVWSKGLPGPGKPLRSSYELCYLFTCEGFERGDASTLDVLEYAPVPTQKRQHSAQKPVPLLERIIDFSTEPGDTVLDTFAGSGSTGVAALRRGRRFVGIEINEDFAAVAERRCADAAAQQDLFGGCFVDG